MIKKKLILFDIDGTLIKGDHPAAMDSMPQAIKKVFKIEKITFDYSAFHGGTDKGIMMAIAQKHGVRKQHLKDKINQLAQARYEYFSLNVTQDYQDRELSGARNLLDILSKNKQIVLGLLTGNFEKVGWHKLKLTGLKKYFQFGVFGDLAANRVDLARQVFIHAKKKLKKEFKPQEILIIGDTPRDVECAKAIGARVVAVTTGAFDKKALAGADLIVNKLDKKVLLFINKWIG